jgi:hypothetical protein
LIPIFSKMDSTFKVESILDFTFISPIIKISPDDHKRSPGETWREKGYLFCL